MKYLEWLDKWGLDLKINKPFLEGDFSFTEEDKRAAWELYVGILANLPEFDPPDGKGNVGAVYDVITKLFGEKRNLIQDCGPACIELLKVVTPVMEQKFRPFLFEK